MRREPWVGQCHWLGTLAAVAVLATAGQAWAWGSYGHEQINAAAITAIETTPLGSCFARNRSAITRLAITPDYDWKLVGTAPTDPELRRLRAAADRYEHPLHFFEADALVPQDEISPATIAAIPGGPWSDVIGTFQNLLAANLPWVITVDPTKTVADPLHPTADDVAKHGSAPWRARQLFDLGVDALVANDTTMAIVYLGAMGHYVGDMSQPFHATLNYDGQYQNLAKGIHSVYESRILELEAARVHATMNHTTQLWSSFSGTEAPVTAALQAAGTPPAVPASAVIPTILELVSTGYALVDPLVRAFSAAPVNGPGSRSVLSTANQRLGDGAATLARLWRSAYAVARARDPLVARIANCEEITFPADTVIRRYPRPDYLLAR